MVNACPMCLRAEETVDHLFLIAPWQRRSGGLSLIFLMPLGLPPHLIRSLFGMASGLGVKKQKVDMEKFFPSCCMDNLE